MLSLVEDLHKAELYSQTSEKLSRQWSSPGGTAKGILGDQFFDVMASALREDLQDQRQGTHGVFLPFCLRACSRCFSVRVYSSQPRPHQWDWIYYALFFHCMRSMCRYTRPVRPV